MTGTLTLKDFLEHRSRTIRSDNPRAAQFAGVMAKRIAADTLTKEDFLSLANEVFPQNAIAQKITVEAWDNFTFQRVVQEVLGQ